MWVSTLFVLPGGVSFLQAGLICLITLVPHEASNQGGDMVAHTLRTVDPNVKIIEVRASRGKHVRAEPVAALYEQGRIRHIGAFPALESQMTQMTVNGFEGDGSLAHPALSWPRHFFPRAS